MKLITYEKPEEESITAVNLKSMILLFVADHNPDTGDISDDAVKSDQQYLKCVYAAYDENNKIHVIVQYYSYSHDEESAIKNMRKSSYFDSSLNSSQVITTINFFTADIAPESSDLISTRTNEGNYCFFSHCLMTDNDGITKESPVCYIINDKIRIGLEMIHSIMGTKRLISSGVTEANIWMYNQANVNDPSYRNLYKHCRVKDFTIKDISKSVKKSKHRYIGAVCMEFTCNNDDSAEEVDDIYTVLMSYVREKKLRSSTLTMDLGLMQTTYESAYTIGMYSAVPLRDEGIYRLIGYSDGLKRFVIFDFEKELYNKFCEKIEKLEDLEK